MSLLAYAAAAIILLGMIGTGLYKVRESGKDAIRLEWREANEAARKAEEKKGNEAAKGLEADRVKTRTVYKTITQQVDKIIDRVEYRHVCLDADGLRIARCAILGESSDTCKPSGTLSPVKPARGWDGGRAAALAGGDFDVLP